MAVSEVSGLTLIIPGTRSGWRHFLFRLLFVRIITFHYISLTSIDLRATSWYILNRSEMTLVRQGSLPKAEPDLPPKDFGFS